MYQARSLEVVTNERNSIVYTLTVTFFCDALKTFETNTLNLRTCQIYIHFLLYSNKLYKL